MFKVFINTFLGHYGSGFNLNVVKLNVKTGICVWLHVPFYIITIILTIIMLADVPWAK